MYNRRSHETITDVAMNATGSITPWETILNLNSFDTWTPDLADYTQLEVSDIIDNFTYSVLQVYPLSNQIDIDDQIDAILDVLEAIESFDTYEVPIGETLTETYTVKGGETITDVVINSTGTIINWETILNANQFDTWTPELNAGDIVIISYQELQSNILRTLENYPLCTSKDSDIDSKIQNLINKFVSTDYYQFSPDGNDYQFSPDGDYYQFDN